MDWSIRIQLGWTQLWQRRYESSYEWTFLFAVLFFNFRNILKTVFIYRKNKLTRWKKVCTLTWHILCLQLVVTGTRTMSWQQAQVNNSATFSINACLPLKALSLHSFHTFSFARSPSMYFPVLGSIWKHVFIFLAGFNSSSSELSQFPNWNHQSWFYFSFV